MAFVLDASVALAWGFPDETSAYGQSVLESLVQTDAVVPAVWPLEVANALLVGERRHRFGPTDVVRFLELLESLPIQLEGISLSRSLGTALELANMHYLSAYDASYLDLALALSLPLATLDQGLRNAAVRAGVPLVE